MREQLGPWSLCWHNLSWLLVSEGALARRDSSSRCHHLSKLELCCWRPAGLAGGLNPSHCTTWCRNTVKAAHRGCKLGQWQRSCAFHSCPHYWEQKLVPLSAQSAQEHEAKFHHCSWRIFLSRNQELEHCSLQDRAAQLICLNSSSRLGFHARNRNEQPYTRELLSPQWQPLCLPQRLPKGRKWYKGQSLCPTWSSATEKQGDPKPPRREECSLLWEMKTLLYGLQAFWCGFTYAVPFRIIDAGEESGLQ